MFEHVKWCLNVFLDYGNKWFGMALMCDEFWLEDACWKSIIFLGMKGISGLNIHSVD